MVPLHGGKFLVVHLWDSSFSIDPVDFPLYQKLQFLETLGPYAHIFKRHKGKIWREGADLGLPSSH